MKYYAALTTVPLDFEFMGMPFPFPAMTVVIAAPANDAATTFRLQHIDADGHCWYAQAGISQLELERVLAESTTDWPPKFGW